MPPSTISEPTIALGLALVHVQLPLVELRQPRADADDGEQQRGDADERVAHGRDAHDRAQVGLEPVPHVA